RRARRRPGRVQPLGRDAQPPDGVGDGLPQLVHDGRQEHQQLAHVPVPLPPAAAPVRPARLPRQPVRSARLLRPVANCWKDGPRSGIEGQISGSSGPVYSSRTVNSVTPPAFGARVNVRTPLNRPSGIPPDQTIRRPGTNSVTLTGNARPGLAFE